MPELPEVQTLASQLNRLLEGREIEGAEILNGTLLETPRQELEKNILGKKIIRVLRRGKYLRIDLSEGWTLWFHLGMTGQLLLRLVSEALAPHTHFLLSFAGSNEQLLFRDVRRFGTIAFTPTAEDAFPRGVQNLGPEPEEWDPEAFATLFKTRRGRIKSLLLNQTLVAGLGNIYSDESLYRAGIRPLERAHRIARRRLERLHGAVCEVLEEALQWGGSSIDDYLHADGTRGRFQEFHQVYGRGGEACRACGTKIRTVKLAGRTSSYCPRCQK